jgi:hypothetical protein
MDATDVAQTASAVFTALTALAALLTVRQARHENRIARDALEAETQPLVTDVPRGVFYEEREWHEVDGTMSLKRFDRSEITLGASGPEPVAGVRVPIRNVGNGPARITQIRFVCVDGTTAPGRVENPVLPPGELTSVGLWATPEDSDWGAAEAMAMALDDFEVVIEYADASSHPREAVELRVANGQHPRVTARNWTRRASEPRAE